jgi:hypothetical protein
MKKLRQRNSMHILSRELELLWHQALGTVKPFFANTYFGQTQQQNRKKVRKVYQFTDSKTPLKAAHVRAHRSTVLTWILGALLSWAGRSQCCFGLATFTRCPTDKTPKKGKVPAQNTLLLIV